jgi:hypothetical protein
MVTGIDRGTKYHVVNENVLCYDYGQTLAGSPYYGVLASSVIRGSTLGPLDGTMVISPKDKVRPATIEDFEIFRVSPKGHLV